MMNWGNAAPPQGYGRSWPGPSPGADTSAYHQNGDTGLSGIIGTNDAVDFVLRSNSSDLLSLTKEGRIELANGDATTRILGFAADADSTGIFRQSNGVVNVKFGSGVVADESWTWNYDEFHGSNTQQWVVDGGNSYRLGFKWISSSEIQIRGRADAPMMRATQGATGDGVYFINPDRHVVEFRVGGDAASGIGWIFRSIPATGQAQIFDELVSSQDPDTGIHWDYSTGNRLSLFAGTATMIDFNATELGFHAATPVAQHSSTGQTAGFTAGSGTGMNDDSTATGGTGTKAYTFGDVVKCLKEKGLMASS